MPFGPHVDVRPAVPAPSIVPARSRVFGLLVEGFLMRLPVVPPPMGC